MILNINKNEIRIILSNLFSDYQEVITSTLNNTTLTDHIDITLPKPPVNLQARLFAEGGNLRLDIFEATCAGLSGFGIVKNIACNTIINKMQPIAKYVQVTKNQGDLVFTVKTISETEESQEPKVIQLFFNDAKMNNILELDFTIKE